MDDFEFDCNIDLNLDFDFVEKHKSSEKVFDFTSELSTNEIMRFDIIRDLKIKIPNKNESYFYLTTKPISLLDVLNYFEVEKGKLSDAIIFFYTVNDKAANYTIELSKRCNLKIIISDLMNSQREKERLITRIFDENNVDIVFCHNHSKIAAFKIGDNHYVLTGSMNAGNNARIESIQVIESKEFYLFVENVFEKFKKEFSIKKRY